MGAIGKGLGAITGGAGGIIGGAVNPLTDSLSQQNQFNLDTVQSPVTQGDFNEAHGKTQQGLTQQQQFLEALQAQNGIQNQSNVYNQLAGIAAGTGPNPAQAALNQATAQNAANQAAMMAGQRGAGSNVGLIARQAAMQGGNLQQQAAQQAAVLQAQQSLGAIGQMGNIAGQQVGQQGSALTNYNQFAQNQQAQMLNAIDSANQSRINQGQVNAGVAAGNTAQKAAVQGQILGAAGKGMAMAHGGPVKKYADGGSIAGPQSLIGQYFQSNIPSLQVNAPPRQMINSGGPQDVSGSMQSGQAAGDAAGKGISALMKSMGSEDAPMQMSGSPDLSSAMTMAAHGGRVPALVSPGERYLPPEEVNKIANGKKSPLKAGEKIKGKPAVGGARDSYKNDTVSKDLEEGGIVLPRSVTQHKNAPKKAAEFVAAILKRESLKGKRK